MHKNKRTMRSKYIKALLVAILIIGACNYSQAQIGLPGGDNNVNDEPAAPIGQLITLGLLVGSYIGIKKIKNK